MGKMREGIFLHQFKAFVPVENQYYGGDQAWLGYFGKRGTYYHQRACGLVAAANALSYLAMSRPSYRSLYPYDDYRLTHYRDFLHDLLSQIKPTPIGIPWVGLLRRQVLRYAKSQGVTLQAHSLSGGRCHDLLPFLQQGLAADSPVLMLTWGVGISDLVYHWVTVTGCFCSTSGTSYVLTSNWGKPVVYALDQIMERHRLYKGFLYFT